MNNLRRRQALALAAGALASSSLLMPGRAHALAPKPAPLDPPVKLTLGANNVPHVCPFHHIAAEAKPLGVEIELVKFARYADTRTALASGSIDAGSIGPADVPIALSQGIKSIGALMGVGRSTKYPIAKKGLALAKWEDLIGPKVGIAPGSAVWFQFAATLIEANIVAGFEQPTAGSLRIDGGPPRRPGPDRAVVFQESALFPWLTVLDNITFGPRIQRHKRGSFEQEAQRIIQLVGLSGFEGHYPDQLSGGMKQRVGIARCLLMQPKLFLMDEPFGALDAQTRLQMQELLLHVWETLKRTVIFITHDIDEAILLADTVYVMSARPGRIRSRNPVDLPRPRDVDMLTDQTFNALRRDILRQIREEAGKSGAAH